MSHFFEDDSHQPVKFKRFVDEIDPYNKVFWQRNILADVQVCHVPAVSTYVEDSLNTSLLKDIEDPLESTEMLIKKLRMCVPTFDFSSHAMATEKGIKKRFLSEILEYLIHSRQVVEPDVYPELISMVKSNILRSLPESTEQLDFEANHYAKEPSWPHLMLVYEIFLQFLQLPSFKITPARLYIDEEFIDDFLTLFHSRDPDERTRLKKILIEIYKTFVVLRSYVRKKFYEICWRYTYQSKYTVGLPNLLEFYSCVVSGFTKPLEMEHVIFYQNIFLKLHSCFMFPGYFSPYVDCLYEFLLKDCSLYSNLIQAMVRYWPKTSSEKQILFLKELNDLLTDIKDNEFVEIMDPLFRQLEKSMTDSNYFVTEAVIDLLHNTNICSLVHKHSPETVPLILPALSKASFDPNNPDLSRVNIILKKYQFQVKDSSLTPVCKNAAEVDRAEKQRTSWINIWKTIDLIEERRKPFLKRVPVQKKILVEEEFELIKISENNKFIIFPESPKIQLPPGAGQAEIFVSQEQETAAQEAETKDVKTPSRSLVDRSEDEETEGGSIEEKDTPPVSDFEHASTMTSLHTATELTISDISSLWSNQSTLNSVSVYNTTLERQSMFFENSPVNIPSLPRLAVYEEIWKKFSQLLSSYHSHRTSDEIKSRLLKKSVKSHFKDQSFGL